MSDLKIVLHEIEPQGLSLVVDDPSVWAGPWTEFGMSCRVVEPLRAEVFLLTQEDGVLIRGKLTGVVALPCDRCLEEAVVRLDHSFDEFEDYPEEPEQHKALAGAESDALAAGEVLVLENGHPVLDLAALLWEEFSLALPVKPLCSPSCGGVCAACGQNLNEGTCGCGKAKGDPRMAALRNFKVT